MTRNYELVYYVAQNVGIIRIPAYPKIIMRDNQSYGKDRFILKILIGIKMVTLHQTWLNFNFFQKNRCPDFLDAQNCIKKDIEIYISNAVLENRFNSLKKEKIIFLNIFLCNLVRLKASDKLSVNNDHAYCPCYTESISTFDF